MNLEEASYGMFGANNIDELFCPVLKTAQAFSLSTHTLKKVNLPSAIELSPLCFEKCYDIQSVQLDVIEEIQMKVFEPESKFKKLIAPNLVSFFNDVAQIEEMVAPKLQNVNCYFFKLFSKEYICDNFKNLQVERAKCTCGGDCKYK